MLGETQTGFLAITKKPDSPFYLSCSQGIVEVYVEKKGSAVLVRLRSNNKEIRFHSTAEHLRRDLGSFGKPSSLL